MFGKFTGKLPSLFRAFRPRQDRASQHNEGDAAFFCRIKGHADIFFHLFQGFIKQNIIDAALNKDAVRGFCQGIAAKHPPHKDGQATAGSMIDSRKAKLFGGNFRPRGGKGNIGAADEAVSDEYDFHLVFSFWTVSSL